MTLHGAVLEGRGVLHCFSDGKGRAREHGRKPQTSQVQLPVGRVDLGPLVHLAHEVQHKRLADQRGGPHILLLLILVLVDQVHPSTRVLLRASGPPRGNTSKGVIRNPCGFVRPILPLATVGLGRHARLLGAPGGLRHLRRIGVRHGHFARAKVRGERLELLLGRGDRVGGHSLHVLEGLEVVHGMLERELVVLLRDGNTAAVADRRESPLTRFGGRRPRALLRRHRRSWAGKGSGRGPGLGRRRGQLLGEGVEVLGHQSREEVLEASALGCVHVGGAHDI
ncbi:uncharacterized protein B0H18DRAFT_643530 [Fomitopsis serialis]|uniref:uncharacterized protein n=1 Tax=Fomitopsis serialis TaxID=139415 RepID=UPI002007BBAF|nr:uncharacterized protein B0H18DRAFT_643530 [Neoantrodia serialis]KAH9933380.1 hypothetical protein B0H18DRAFT_643530 [Neoantrodia serialis]